MYVRTLYYKQSECCLTGTTIVACDFQRMLLLQAARASDSGGEFNCETLIVRRPLVAFFDSQGVIFFKANKY